MKGCRPIFRVAEAAGKAPSSGVAMVTERCPESRVPASIVIAPIVEGRLDDWHSFHAELTGHRRGAWAESQRRRGITREVIFFWSSPAGPSAVYMMEGVRAGEAMSQLESSTDAFDIWLWGRFADLHGDLDFPAPISDTRLSPGAWRGWRGLRLRGRGD